MNIIRFNLFFLYCLVFFPVQVMAEQIDLSSWKLDKLIQKNNVSVALYGHKNSEIKAFKVETHVNASLDSVLAVFMDSQSCMEWVHGCKGSKLIERVSFNEQYHYQICDLPFPFKDRDFIFHSIMNQDPITKVVTITLSAENDYCKENQTELCGKINHSELVRVKKSIGVYELKPDEKGTSITWIQHTDPSGNLPAWLVNQFVQDTPYWTMVNLAKQVQQNQYQQAKLIYNDKGSAVSLVKPQIENAHASKTFEHFASF